jgi:hypothetical protein
MPLASDPAWRESAAGFGERLRANIQDTVFADGFQRQWGKVRQAAAGSALLLHSVDAMIDRLCRGVHHLVLQ